MYPGAGCFRLSAAVWDSGRSQRFPWGSTCASPIGSAGLGLVFGLIGALTAFGTRRLKKELSLGSQALQETFRRHLGDSAISEEAMNAFTARMNDFKRLCTATETSEAAVQSLTREIAALQQTQTDCNEIIGKAAEKPVGTGEKAGTAGQL